MKKIIICNIPMRESEEKYTYKNSDLSLKTIETPTYFPINAFLGANLSKDDEVKVLLLTKKDGQEKSKQNIANFIDEFMSLNEGCKVEYKIIETDYSELQIVHETLLSKIIDEIEEDSQIYADITYGPKDLPIVIFAALNFAERYLHCDIENILYGKATFVNGKPTQTELCDMVPLYYLNSATNTIRCEDPKKARELLKELLSI